MKRRVPERKALKSQGKVFPLNGQPQNRKTNSLGEGDTDCQSANGERSPDLKGERRVFVGER